MARIKSALKIIFNPPPAITLILAAVGYASVLAVPVFNIEDPVWKYASYLLSAYALVITITGLKYLKPFAVRIKKAAAESRAAKKLRSSRFADRYLSDVHFRTKISLYIGLFINLCYIAVKIFAGIRYRSAWFLALAVYYILLAAMRFVLVRHSGGQADLREEYRLYRRCGIILLLMNQALACIVVFMVQKNRGFDYPGYLIYAMAFYSFYAIISAAVSVVKARRHQSPVLSAAKIINLVAAMVSLLSLTTAMLSRFGGDDAPEFKAAMVASVGGGVCTAVIVMAVYMIMRSAKISHADKNAD